MSFNLLAISVGNTRTRIGAFAEGQLTEADTISNAQADQLGDALEHAYAALHQPGSTVLIASVRPAVSEKLAAMVTQRLGVSPCYVERDFPIPIGRQLDREAIVGEDRLLNAAAAYDILKQACVVVDAGTAITVDLIDGQGTFHGGAIAPGAQTMLDALTQRTALLPEIQFAPPQEPIGHNTMQAMQVGVYHALRGLVRELTEQYAEQLGSYPLVVATGGDANLLFREYELVDRIVPELTLMGMGVCMRVMSQQLRDDSDD